MKYCYVNFSSKVIDVRRINLWNNIKTDINDCTRTVMNWSQHVSYPLYEIIYINMSFISWGRKTRDSETRRNERGIAE